MYVIKDVILTIYKQSFETYLMDGCFCHMGDCSSESLMVNERSAANISNRIF